MPPSRTIKIENTEIGANNMIIGNVNYFGGFVPFPDGIIDDGLFNIIFGEYTRSGIIFQPYAAAQGRRNVSVGNYRTLKRMKIESAIPR